MALARKHSSLSDDQWQAVSFRALLCSELDPYDDGSRDRIKLNGPALSLPADVALPLSMAIHELTTNAVKHGSLSVPGGTLAVSWDVHGEAGERQLWFDWVERDGPAVVAPTRRGFGSQLLERVLTNQIGATVTFHYNPEGLAAHAVVPFAPRSNGFRPMDSVR